MENRNQGDIVCENEARYMRFEPNPYRGNRWAVYERRNYMPDQLIFRTHNENAARLFWDRIKDQPIQNRKTDFIYW